MDNVCCIIAAPPSVTSMISKTKGFEKEGGAMAGVMVITCFELVKRLYHSYVVPSTIYQWLSYLSRVSHKCPIKYQLKPKPPPPPPPLLFLRVGHSVKDIFMVEFKSKTSH